MLLREKIDTNLILNYIEINSGEEDVDVKYLISFLYLDKSYELIVDNIDIKNDIKMVDIISGNTDYYNEIENIIYNKWSKIKSVIHSFNRWNIFIKYNTTE